MLFFQVGEHQAQALRAELLLIQTIHSEKYFRLWVFLDGTGSGTSEAVYSSVPAAEYLR